MSSTMWIRVAGALGASAIGLGAIGAHAIVKRSDTMKDVWKTAAQYHLIHSLALAMAAYNTVGKKRNVVCTLFLGGIVLFSGACYTVVIMDDRVYGKTAPFGGMMFIFGWLALGFM